MIENSSYRITVPPDRLRNYSVGDFVMLHSDGSQIKYIVKAIRDDGYYELRHKRNDWDVIASPCHLTVRKKSEKNSG